MVADFTAQQIPQASQQVTISDGSGFSIVEVLVAFTLFAAAVVVTASTFGGTSYMFRQSQEKNELGSLVDADIAYIMRSNDRLTCTSGGACIISASDTDRNSYFPTVNSSGEISAIEQTNLQLFEAICTTTDTSSGFAAKLGSLLLPPADARIARTITPAANNSPAHQYSVTYTTATGQYLRQIHLIPTTVSWCSAFVP